MGEMEGTRRTVAMTHEEVCFVVVAVRGWVVRSAMLGESGESCVGELAQLVAKDNDLTRFPRRLGD